MHISDRLCLPEIVLYWILESISGNTQPESGIELASPPFFGLQLFLASYLHYKAIRVDRVLYYQVHKSLSFDPEKEILFHFEWSYITSCYKGAGGVRVRNSIHFLQKRLARPLISAWMYRWHTLVEVMSQSRNNFRCPILVVLFTEIRFSSVSETMRN